MAFVRCMAVAPRLRQPTPYLRLAIVRPSSRALAYTVSRALLCRGTASTNKGVIDSARMSVVTMDEILTKLDVVLEEVIGCEVEFLGAPPLSSPEAQTLADSRIILTSAEVIEVDRRLAARLLTNGNSAYRTAFDTVFQKAVAALLSLDAQAIRVLQVEPADGKFPGQVGSQELFPGVNPALFPGFVAQETHSRVAAFFGAGDASTGDGRAPPSLAMALVVRYAVEAPSDVQAQVSAQLQALGEQGGASIGPQFRKTFRKGTLGKLNDVLERSDDLLRLVEPQLDPAFEKVSGTLTRLNLVLDRGHTILKYLEPRLDPALDDVKSTLRRANGVLDHTEVLVKRAEFGLDASVQRGAEVAKVARVLLEGATSLVVYVKFALLGVGVCGFAIAYGIFRVLALTYGGGESSEIESVSGPKDT